MGDVLKDLAPVIDRRKLVISIAAGIPSASSPST
jgi:pyrroline-5-carboxylate reductase